MNAPTPYHANAVRGYSDATIEAAIADLGRRNLRDQSNHEVRWMAERSTALRSLRRERKALLSPPKRVNS